MHYANGREAKNGDKVIMASGYSTPAVGVLYDAVAGSDACNGNLAPVTFGQYANLSECLHVDDFKAAFAGAFKAAPDTSKPAAVEPLAE